MNIIIRTPRASCLRDSGLVMLYVGNIYSPGAVGVRPGEERRTNVMPICSVFFFTLTRSPECMRLLRFASFSVPMHKKCGKYCDH